MVRKKSEQQRKVYKAAIGQAFRWKNHEPFTFHDLVVKVGTFGCTPTEVQEVGRIFAFWVRKAPNHPIRVLKEGTPLVYIKI